MSRIIKKSITLFIAVWLPLFSGNVLAVSVGMKSMGNGCHAAVQQDEHHLHQDSQHFLSAADQDQSSCIHDQKESGCGNSGICHLACSGYLAAASINVPEAQTFSQSFTSTSTQFISVALTLLDPPPLARA